MKTLTLILLLFTAFTVSAQDSIKINVNIQVRDLEYITATLPYLPQFEDLYDAIKKKFRVATPPSNNTLVAIDSIYNSTWFYVLDRLRVDPVAVSSSVFSRVETILRAKNNVWLNSNLDLAITEATDKYTNLRALGRKKLTRK